MTGAEKLIASEHRRLAKSYARHYLKHERDEDFFSMAEWRESAEQGGLIDLFLDEINKARCGEPCADFPLEVLAHLERRVQTIREHIRLRSVELAKESDAGQAVYRVSLAHVDRAVGDVLRGGRAKLTEKLKARA